MLHKLLTVMILATVSLGAVAQGTQFSSESLIKAPVTGIEGHNVLMSRITIPTNTTLPRHYHPTEEFLYILAGKAYLRIDGREDQLLIAGMSAIIPAGEVHTAVTKESDALALTYRVHPIGQPVRLPPPATKE